MQLSLMIRNGLNCQYDNFATTFVVNSLTYMETMLFCSYLQNILSSITRHLDNLRQQAFLTQILGHIEFMPVKWKLGFSKKIRIRQQSSLNYRDCMNMYVCSQFLDILCICVVIIFLWFNSELWLIVRLVVMFLGALAASLPGCWVFREPPVPPLVCTCGALLARARQCWWIYSLIVPQLRRKWGYVMNNLILAVHNKVIKNIYIFNWICVFMYIQFSITSWNKLNPMCYFCDF